MDAGPDRIGKGAGLDIDDGAGGLTVSYDLNQLGEGVAGLRTWLGGPHELVAARVGLHELVNNRAGLPEPGKGIVLGDVAQSMRHDGKAFLDDGMEQSLLVVEVVIDAHRGDLSAGRNGADSDSLRAVLLQQLRRGMNHFRCQ